MCAERRTPGLLLAAVLPALAATAGCPVIPADTPVSEFKCTTEKTKAAYYLYVPSNYQPLRRWPMVVTLQGTPGFDDARRQAQEWRGLAEDHGFLVLAPALRSTQGVLPVGRSSRLTALAEDERRVLDAIAEVKGRYKVDEKAVMITGFSAGGYPLYYIGLRNAKLFSALVARTCNCDLAILKTIPVTDKVRAMPILIFFSKSGISPISSNWNPVAKQSWGAFRHLRRQKCREARIKAIPGGHQRKAERAFRFWQEHQPQLRPVRGG